MRKLSIVVCLLVLTSTPAIAEDSEWWIDKGWPVATSEELLDRAIEIIRDQDQAAWNDLVYKNPGRVAITPAVEKVTGVKIHVFGPSEFRFPGTSTVFLTPTKAISSEKP